MGIGDGVTRNPSVYDEALLLLMELGVPGPYSHPVVALMPLLSP